MVDNYRLGQHRLTVAMDSALHSPVAHKPYLAVLSLTF